MTVSKALSNWQAHLAQFVLILLLTVTYQPSFNIYNKNDQYIVSEMVLTVIWILLFSLITLKAFVIFHDCGHNSFFQDEYKNELFGKILQSFVCTPFNHWKETHNKHHAIQGRMDKYDFSATIHFTVNDIRNIKNIYLRLLYLIFRCPLIFFIITPFLLWFIWFPIICIKKRQYIALSGHFVRPFILFIFASNNVTFGFCFKLHIATTFICAALGVILFHIQHSVNPPYRKTKNDGFNRIDAAIHGSYCHKVPFILKLFTMGIEYHSLHHFDTRLAGYKLEYYYHKIQNDDACTFDDKLINVKIIDYNNIYKCMFNIAYHRDTNRYISWSQCIQEIYFKKVKKL